MESSSVPRSRRSRVVTSQSKRGCMTCKARRVKCDEQKPLCRRCVQAGRPCRGYLYNDESKPSEPAALLPALRTGVAADSQTERLSHLAAHVLSLDNNGLPLQIDGVWGRIFLQLSNQTECVKAAAAAFGAAYESSLDDAVVVNLSPTPWRYYGLALSKLQSDISNETAGTESLVLASMILACAEILSQHEQNAFTHFLGAVKILTGASQPRRGSTSAEMLTHIRDELLHMNLSIGSYALAQTPVAMHLASRSKATEDEVPAAFCELQSHVKAAMLYLHQAYQFIESAAQFRYKHPSQKNDNAARCQRRTDAVNQCRVALHGLATAATRLQAQHASAPPTPADSEALAEIYALRTQVTAALVFLLCIHSPFQTGYDNHGDLFRAIVRDAAASARLRRRSKPTALKRFSTRPGIVGPLFIVSAKCRDPPLRALATAMLGEQGREGPTDGRIMAAIGTRLAALETAGCVPLSSEAALVASDVLESQRIHGYGVSPPRVDGEGRRVVDVEFSRPRVPLEEGWGQVDYTSMENWTLWREPVEI